MAIFDSINIGSSGLTAQRLRMDTISKNIANANTTRTASGTPYKRQIVVLKSAHEPSFKSLFNKSLDKSVSKGVEVSAIKEDDTPFKKVYDPGNPDADKEGYIQMPNVNIITEMVNLIAATRSYEANVTAINENKSMMMKAMEIGK